MGSSRIWRWISIWRSVRIRWQTRPWWAGREVRVAGDLEVPHEHQRDLGLDDRCEVEVAALDPAEDERVCGALSLQDLGRARALCLVVDPGRGPNALLPRRQRGDGNDELEGRRDVCARQDEVGEGVGSCLVERHRVSGLASGCVVLPPEGVDSAPDPCGHVGRQSERPRGQAGQVGVRPAPDTAPGPRALRHLLEPLRVRGRGRPAGAPPQLCGGDVADIGREDPGLELLEVRHLEDLAGPDDGLGPPGLELTPSCHRPDAREMPGKSPRAGDPGGHGPR